MGGAGSTGGDVVKIAQRQRKTGTNVNGYGSRKAFAKSRIRPIKFQDKVFDSMESVLQEFADYELDFDQIVSLLALRSSTSRLPDDETIEKFQEGGERLGMSEEDYERNKDVARIASRYSKFLLIHNNLCPPGSAPFPVSLIAYSHTSGELFWPYSTSYSL